jgi:hypothetical protein
MKSKHPPGEPMDLGNMRQLGVHHLIATCLSDACRHQGLIDVSNYPDDTEVPSFASWVVGARSRHIDVRPNWKEQPPRPSLTSKESHDCSGQDGARLLFRAHEVPSDD